MSTYYYGGGHLIYYVTLPDDKVRSVWRKFIKLLIEKGNATTDIIKMDTNSRKLGIVGSEDGAPINNGHNIMMTYASPEDKANGNFIYSETGSCNCFEERILPHLNEAVKEVQLPKQFTKTQIQELMEEEWKRRWKSKYYCGKFSTRWMRDVGVDYTS